VGGDESQELVLELVEKLVRVGMIAESAANDGGDVGGPAVEGDASDSALEDVFEEAGYFSVGDEDGIVDHGLLVGRDGFGVGGLNGLDFFAHFPGSFI
jgi:hypothetical protein